MMRQMGSFLGNLFGEYMLTDQIRKDKQYGSILRIHVKIDFTKPLRWCVAIQLEGRVVEVDIRYEKLPLYVSFVG